MRWHGCVDIDRDLRLVLPGRRDRLDSTVELHPLLDQARRNKGGNRIEREKWSAKTCFNIFVPGSTRDMKRSGTNAVLCSNRDSDFCVKCPVKNTQVPVTGRKVCSLAVLLCLSATDAKTYRVFIYLLVVGFCCRYVANQSGRKKLL